MALLASKRLAPLRILAGILSAIGKPFYFIFSRALIGIIIVFYAIRKPKKKEKVIYKKIRLPKLKVPKIAFPRIKLPKVGSIFKIEELKVELLELKIFGKIKKFFAKKLTRFQKLQIKKRITLVTILVILISLILFSYFSIFRGLPSPKDLTKNEPQVSTKIYDRNGNLLYKIFKDENRTIVPLTQIPIHVRLATLAAEDAEFYSHPGFSIKGMLRAFIYDLESGNVQGGSTITQQLVKNVLLTPEKTLTRKIKEIILSVEVETTYTKDQILEMYLNEVSYGGTAYGIEEASREYFGKDVADLNLAESAFLAGLPKSPTAYSPFGQSPEIAMEREREVLHLMTVNKFITPEQEEEADITPLTFVPNKTEIKAPHFVMYIRKLLVDKYGEDMVEKGGLEVTTSLDLSIQSTAEEVVAQEVENLKALHVGNGAALVVNPQTGEILGMVGSKNYFDVNGDGNVNVTLSLRSPGSSIKVVNYSYALANGYTPASIIDDSPITYSTPGSPPYSPRNYDGKFVGPVSLRSALAQSRNIPAVKVLASYGVSKMIAQGEKMGILTWGDSSQYGLSLTLGGGAVTALDMTKVYSTLASGGKKPELMPILQVKDYKGHVLEKNTPAASQEIDPRIAFLITDILKDNTARSPEFGLNSSLVVKDHPEVAVKTGTSQDLRDNWTIGYNQNFLVLTWVGNNDNSPMSQIASGITGAAPIWNKIMSAILATQPSVDWKVPEGVSKINICTISATLPCNNCPTRQEWFLDENKPTKYCNPDLIEKTLHPEPQTSNGNILPFAASTYQP